MMQNALKSLLKKMGYKVSRYSPLQNSHCFRQSMLEHWGINVVFDVGANAGQYAKQLRDHGYDNLIVSFEPLSAAFAELSETAAGHNKWQVCRCAIGEHEGSVPINVSKNSWSSSLLAMRSEHTSAAPDSAYVDIETVDMRTLDQMLPLYTKDSDKLFVKIDTQGYTMPVFKGAEETLRRAHGLQVEMSLIPLYENETLIDGIIAYVYQHGFSLLHITPEFVDTKSGRQLQVDGLFGRA